MTCQGLSQTSTLMRNDEKPSRITSKDVKLYMKESHIYCLPAI